MLDLLFSDIWVADGSGAPLFRASVGVKDGKIVKIGRFDEPAATVITANADSVLTPGFIDMHSHNDALKLFDPYLTPQVLQGVTFDVCGNCGISAAPVSADLHKAGLLRKYIGTVMPVDRVQEQWQTMHTFQDYMDAVARQGVKINTGAFIGHGTLRIAVMGMDDRAPTADELAQMCELAREAMEAGALGLSSGLIYTPGVYSGIDEMAALCEVVARYDGVYATHMRNESLNVVKSLEEALTVARRSGVKLLVSHLKVVGDKTKALHRQLLKLMDEARAEGVRVIADQYLYNYGSTLLNALFPPKYQAGGGQRLIEQLRDADMRAAIVRDLETDLTYENFFGILGAEAVLIISCPKTRELNGKTLAQIGAIMGVSPGEAAAELMVRNDGGVLVAIRLSEEEVIEEIWRHPFTAAGSDGIGAGTGQLTHPRAYGAIARIFGTYVRERGVTTLEEAVRKCTSLPAGFLGLSSKGLVREGMDADLVVFDRARIGSRASFENPICKPEGMEYVFVGGEMVVKGDQTV